MGMLSIIKTYLGITDTLQDELLTQIIADYTTRVNNYVDESILPAKLEWIVRELSIVRYNYIGSEGMKSESEEGKSLTFNEGDPFLTYTIYLDAYTTSKTNEPSRGKARFI